MARKVKSKSGKKTKPKPESPTGQKAQEHTKEENDNAMDFGGIPHRDLKKNLGCG
jgi:hypothetical protein